MYIQKICANLFIFGVSRSSLKRKSTIKLNHMQVSSLGISEAGVDEFSLCFKHVCAYLVKSIL